MFRRVNPHPPVSQILVQFVIEESQYAGATYSAERNQKPLAKQEPAK